MYIIPRFLDKVLACHYLKSEMNDWDIITAGDGFVDESFLKEGNIQKYNVDTSKLDSNQKKGVVCQYRAFSEPRKIPTFFIVTGEGQK